jgi:hypothetical protein
MTQNPETVNAILNWEGDYGKTGHPGTQGLQVAGMIDCPVLGSSVGDQARRRG